MLLFNALLTTDVGDIYMSQIYTFGLTDCLTGSTNKWGRFYYSHSFSPRRASGLYWTGLSAPSIMEAGPGVSLHMNYQPYFPLGLAAWHIHLPWHRRKQTFLPSTPHSVKLNNQRPASGKRTHGKLPQNTKFQFLPVPLITAFLLERHSDTHPNLITLSIANIYLAPTVCQDCTKCFTGISAPTVLNLGR